jgi:protein arginine phosphatase
MNTEASAGVAKPRVLFVCTGNTCRSVLAEHIARKKFGKYIEPSSAGLRPGTTADAENAIYTLKDLMGIDASGHVPRDVRAANVELADLVIAMNNQVAGEVRRLFPELPPERLVRWQIQDPYGDNLAQYRRCANKIYEQLRKLALLAGKS